ncbi:HXXEE domain-containing protein [Cytobacillus purgationiresistens]|uniref:K+-sensing histidine kinase KdpD n=1 Tax=Cytobacillus purgationiresistens TaxID=863449 RepID=A0ABU0AT01_9BACI|nr:HXXEE domain-containing protein [Cytobacillus purgationiresistens]MDQ0273558.1 K+-sensing histidine kinase KdpD [Cytobacillus purgationiresistens]
MIEYLFIGMFLVVFMLHNFEEIILIESWFKNTYPKVKHRIPNRISTEVDKMKRTTAAQFSIDVLILFIIAIVLIGLTLLTNNYILFLGLNLFFALNIFIHPIQSLLLKAYVPGLISTILIVFPYNLFFFYIFIREDLIDWLSVLYCIPIIILLVGVLVISQSFSRKLLKNE